jgi:hypothetical protein
MPGWEVVKTPGGVVHVCPIGDTEDHDMTTSCWCGPTDVGGPDGAVWSHHARDRREEREKILQ